MQNLFISILNMSITASYVIAAIVIIRLLLKNVPKKFSYILWSAAAFRLMIPFSFESVFSLFSLKPFDMTKAQSISSGYLTYVQPMESINDLSTITTGMPALNTVVNDTIPDTAIPNSMFNGAMSVISYIWLAGFILLVLYGVASYIALKSKMSTAVLLRDNIYQSDIVNSPFILGIVKPKIYIPFNMERESFDYVIEHEKYHLKRFDYIVKVIAYVILCVHWFNPLCWLAFSLMSKDMEMSCDEKVLSENEGIKKMYSTALLSFSTAKKFPSPSPLCFGECSIKSRIKNILKFKKPAAVLSVAAIVLCFTVIIGCSSNPLVKEKSGLDNTLLSGMIAMSDIENMNIGAEMPQIFYADDNEIILYGTCGIIAFDYKEQVIKDRVSNDRINELGLNEYFNKAVSQDGNKFYLIDNTVDENENVKGFYYDFEKKEIVKLEPIKTDKLFKWEYIIDDVVNGEYSDYFDNNFLTGYLAAKVENKLFYLRAYNDWSMKSLQLVICDLDKKEIADVVSVFENYLSSTEVYTAGSTLAEAPYLSSIIYDGSAIYPEIKFVGDELIITDGENNVYRYSVFAENDIDFKALEENLFLSDIESLFDGRKNLKERNYYYEHGTDAPDYTVYYENDKPFAFYSGGRLFELIPSIRNLDTAVTDAILKNSKNDDVNADYSVESHYTLLTKKGDINGKNKDICITVYTYAYYADLIYDEYFEVINQTTLPTAITFDVTENGDYVFKDFNEYYNRKELKKYFPENAISQMELFENDEKKLAQAAFAEVITNTDYNKDIEKMIDKIVKSDKHLSSYPKEYYILINYGEYAIRYIYSQFINGNETGDKGQVMNMIMCELLGYDAIEYNAKNGQDYFDHFLIYYNNIFKEASDLDEYLKSLKETSPYIYILFEMTNKQS